MIRLRDTPHKIKPLQNTENRAAPFVKHTGHSIGGVGRKAGDYMAIDKGIKDSLKEDPRFKKELKRITDLFKDLPKDKKTLVSRLIENAAFMAILLDDLQQDIKSNGYQSQYQNGENQWGYKRSIAADLYQATIKNYSNTIKLLSDLLVHDVPDDDGFDEFVDSRQ